MSKTQSSPQQQLAAANANAILIRTYVNGLNQIVSELGHHQFTNDADRRRAIASAEAMYTILNEAAGKLADLEEAIQALRQQAAAPRPNTPIRREEEAA